MVLHYVSPREIIKKDSQDLGARRPRREKQGLQERSRAATQKFREGSGPF